MSNKKKQTSNGSEFDPAMLPMLPTGWGWASVEQLAQPNEQPVLTGPFGSTLGSEDFIDKGIPLLTIGCLTEAGITLDKAFFIAEAKANDLARYKVRMGDLLFSRSASVGRAGLVTHAFSGSVINYHLMRLRLDAAVLDPRLFIYYVRGSDVVRRYLRAVNHGATRDGINTSDLLKMPVSVPPVGEQRRIVTKIEELFSDLDAGVAALTRAKANLKRYRAAVLKAAVTGQLTASWRAEHRGVEPAGKLLTRILATRRRKWEQDQLAKFATAIKSPPKSWQAKYTDPTPPDTTNLPTLPTGWCWATLDAVADIVGGITKDKKREGKPGMREVPYLRVANVQRGFLDLTEMKNIVAPKEEISELLLSKGDILFTEGGDRDKLGRGWVWNDELPECIHQNHIFRARLFLTGVQPQFVSHHGNTFGQEWFTKTGKQTTNLASINMGILRRFPVPLPPSPEQAEIVAQVAEKLSQIEAAEATIGHALSRAARLRQYILHRAFSGQLVPQDPHEIVA